jgi:hypothetical protein
MRPLLSALVLRFLAPIAVCTLAATTLSSCASDAATAPSGLSGTYALRAVDGQAVPFSPATCSPGCTLESGSLQVLAADSVVVRQTTSTPPSNGLPGTASIAIGLYRLYRSGTQFAMLTPGQAPGSLADTLAVRGDTLVIHSLRPGFATLRTYTR